MITIPYAMDVANCTECQAKQLTTHHMRLQIL